MITILGYYNKSNLGDEAYKLSFPILIKNSNLDMKFEFKNPEEMTVSDDTELIICGGGDIVNDYFNNKLKKIFKRIRCPIYAVSIGVTYPSTITGEYLGHFDKIYMRHATHASDVAAYSDVYVIPDLAFILPKQIPIVPERRTIGVFVATGMEKYARALTTALKKLPYDIVFYAFNTSDEEHESDIVHARKHYSEFKQGAVIKSPIEMMKVIGGLHLAICMRYHSHIFSMIQCVPFVSIAETPKVNFLVEDFENNVATSPDEIETAIEWSLLHRDELIDAITVVSNDNREILESLRLELPNTTDKIISDAQQLLADGTTPEVISAHVLRGVTGTITNKYTYGMVENIRNGKSLHDMISWVASNHRNNRITGLQLLQTADEFANVHRSGWEFASSYLKTLQTPDGILCDLYTDGTFLWNEAAYASQGIIPYKKLWMGFIHHTPHPFNEYNLNKLFNTKSFLLSLRNCRALIALSSYIRDWLKNKLAESGFDNVRVFMIKHPSEFTHTTFNMYSFSANPRVVQVGAWLRDPYAIYRMNTWMRKYVLVGANMSNYVLHDYTIRNGASCTGCERHSSHNHANRANHALCSCAQMYKWEDDCDPEPGKICRRADTNICKQYVLDYLWDCGAPTIISFGECDCGVKRFDTRIAQLNKLLKNNYNSVTTITQLDNTEYDKLLSNSVVMIKLEDASAVNTIIECIIRNTPVMVNRLPAVVEYLGPKYPLYYDNLSETANFTIEHIRSAHIYLTKLNKVDLMIDSFVSSVKAILQQLRK